MSMAYDPHRHHRRSIRLKGYNYAQPGMYFVTINTQGKEHLFGEVVDGEMVLSQYGQIADQCWQAIPHVELDAFVVMPNHIHGIIHIVGADDGPGRCAAFAQAPAQAPAGPTPGEPARPHNHARANASPPHAGPTRRGGGTGDGPPTLRSAPSGSLGAIIGNFKSVVTRRINRMRRTPGAKVWQRNYHEHIIRNEQELECIRTYIAANPARWEQDRKNPHRIATTTPDTYPREEA